MPRFFIILHLCILVICCCHEPCLANPFISVKKAYDLANGLYQSTVKIQKSLDAGTTNDGIINHIDSRLLELSTDFHELKLEFMEKISMDLRSKLEVKTDKLFSYMQDIQRQYQKMINFIANDDKYLESNLTDFAHVTTSSSLVGLEATIEKMHEVFTREDVIKKSIINMIAEDSTAGDTMCVRAQSSQQVLNGLFQLIIFNDVKRLVMALYSYDLLKKFDKNPENDSKYDFVKEQEFQKYKDRVSSTYLKVKNAYRITSREIWRCDPDKYILDVTYTKLFDVLQGYVHLEKDIVDDGLHLLTQECRSQKKEKEICRTSTCRSVPDSKRCNGNLRDCDRLGDKYEVCFTALWNSRRYLNMKVGDNILGPKGTCKGEEKTFEETFPIYDPYSACFCTCESGDYSVDRYFSLFNAGSDVAENKVITGIRLRKIDNIFRIECQQGTLGPNGTIVDKPEWKISSIPSSLVGSNSNYYQSKEKVIETESGQKTIKNKIYYSKFIKNAYIYAMTYEQRTVYLDDLTLPKGQILTVAKFIQDGDDLKLSIGGTSFDYVTGKLDKDSFKLYSSSIGRQNRHEIVLEGSDNPHLFSRSDVYSRNGSYVKFTTTDVKKDLAQTMVPFIDIQSVETSPPMPLSGVGIFHKKTGLSGGYLAFKIFHYDFASHS